MWGRIELVEANAECVALGSESAHFGDQRRNVGAGVGDEGVVGFSIRALLQRTRVRSYDWFAISVADESPAIPTVHIVGPPLPRPRRRRICASFDGFEFFLRHRRSLDSNSGNGQLGLPSTNSKRSLAFRTSPLVATF